MLSLSKVLQYPARRIAVLRKGSIAILDQAMISGSNFAIGILLARWLSPEGYGTYALTFSIFLLLSQIQQALLLEPQSVLGPSRFADQPPQYLGALLRLCLGPAALMATVLGTGSAIAYFFGHNILLSKALAGVSHRCSTHTCFLAG